MLKKTLAVLMAVCFILMAFTACAKPTAPTSVATQAPATEASAAPAATAPAEQKIVVGLIMINLTHPFHRGEMEGAKECARRYGVELRIVSGDDDVNKQIQAFENLVSQKVNAISVNCIDVNAFGPAFQKAKDAGIPIIIQHSRSDMATAYVGFDEAVTGTKNGEYAVELLTKKNGSPKGEVAVLMGLPGQTAIAPRTDAFVEVMKKYPDIKVDAVEPTNWDPVKAVQITENWLTAFPALDLVYGCSDGLTVPAAEAIEKAGKRASILVTSCDGSDFALEAIKQGKMESTFMYAPEYSGYMKALIPIQVAMGKEYAKETLMSGVLVTKDNVDKMMTLASDIKNKITEFDFEAPLAEIIQKYSK